MVKTLASACAISVILLSVAGAAAAQTAAGDGNFHLGGIVGAAAVQNVGGLAGAEVGWHQSRSLELIAAGVWFRDTVSRRRIETAESLAAHLQQTQGSPSTGTLDAPTWAIIGGARWIFGSGKLRPYVLGEAGAARVTLRPEITIAGSDVTPRLTDFGVTLGEDLTGSAFRPAVGGGVGVLMARGRWVFDGGFRLLSIQMPDQSTNVIGAKLGVGYGF